MTSSRLPGKVLMPAGGKPLLQILIERLQCVERLDAIVIATTVNDTDDAISALAERIGVGVFRGSEEDVLGRVCGALRANQADVCIEITGDCPLIDPHIVSETLSEFLRTRDRHPYVSNSDPYRAVPAGLDVQVFSTAALYQLSAETSDALGREHVSYGFYRRESGNRWRPRFLVHASCRGSEDILVTLDYLEDYELIKHIYEDLSSRNPCFTAPDIVAWVRSHSDLHERCRRVRQNSAA